MDQGRYRCNRSCEGVKEVGSFDDSSSPEEERAANVTKEAVNDDGKGFNVREREFLTDNLLVRIHLLIEIILVDRPCAMGA